MFSRCRFSSMVHAHDHQLILPAPERQQWHYSVNARCKKACLIHIFCLFFQNVEISLKDSKTEMCRLTALCVLMKQPWQLQNIHFWVSCGLAHEILLHFLPAFYYYIILTCSQVLSCVYQGHQNVFSVLTSTHSCELILSPFFFISPRHYESLQECLMHPNASEYHVQVQFSNF